jgi:hypothetical protein
MDGWLVETVGMDGFLLGHCPRTLVQVKRKNNHTAANQPNLCVEYYHVPLLSSATRRAKTKKNSARSLA